MQGAVLMSFIITIFYSSSSHASTKSKILFFGLPISYSHFHFDCSIAEWLVEEGYDIVTFL